MFHIKNQKLKCKCDCVVKKRRLKLNERVSEITATVYFVKNSINDIILHNISNSSLNKSIVWPKTDTCSLASKNYNGRKHNVYLGKVCAKMYTMKMCGNEPSFSKNKRKCAATPRTYID